MLNCVWGLEKPSYRILSYSLNTKLSVRSFIFIWKTEKITRNEYIQLEWRSESFANKTHGWKHTLLSGGNYNIFICLQFPALFFLTILKNMGVVFPPSEHPSVQDDFQHPDLQLQVWQPEEAHDKWYLHRETSLPAPVPPVSFKIMENLQKIGGYQIDENGPMGI